ncbi:MAG: hypothetical protein CMP48_09235 [Rickettsiales bacterium]|nr:hypothetical protein [Rickettsiales bacterium]
MKSTILCNLIVLSYCLPSFSQSSDSYYSKTFNGIEFTDYRFYNNTTIVDSLEAQYPNRTATDFFNISSAERDTKVVINWGKFSDEFIASIDYDEFIFEKRKASIYFTLNFAEDGQLDYVLFNWLDGLKFPEMTEHFVEFTSNYDFSKFPQGEYWSQCGTMTINRNDLKKASRQLASK